MALETDDLIALSDAELEEELFHGLADVSNRLLDAAEHVHHVLGARTPRVDARVDGPRRAVLRLLDPDCGPRCRVAGLTG
jgi:hypothetical protein